MFGYTSTHLLATFGAACMGESASIHKWMGNIGVFGTTHL